MEPCEEEKNIHTDNKRTDIHTYNMITNKRFEKGVAKFKLKSNDVNRMGKRATGGEQQKKSEIICANLIYAWQTIKMFKKIKSFISVDDAKCDARAAWLKNQQ